MGIKRGFRFRNPQMGNKMRIPLLESANEDKTRIPLPETANGGKTRVCVKMIKKQIKAKINKLTSTIPLSGWENSTFRSTAF